jgi:hypothetical protein
LVVGLLALSFACDDETHGKPETGDAGTAHGDRDGGMTPGRDGGMQGLDASTPELDAGVARDAGRDASTDEDGGVVADKTRVVSVVPEYSVAGEPYKYEGKTNEPGQAEWTVKSGPDGMTSDGTTIAWEPTKSQAGEHEIKVEAKINDKAVEQTATVTVATSEKRAETKSAASEGGSAVVTAPTSKIQGASITVSKGATGSDQPITISELDTSPKMAGKSGEAHAVQFGPSGTVFAKPALVALPLPSDVVVDVNRLGAFVHEGGRWERVSVVRADLENRVLYARALHFSPYIAAVSALGLELELYRGAAESACEGRLFSRVHLTETLAEVDAAAINNPSESLKALIEGGVNDVEHVLLTDGLSGSLRFVRVVDLKQGSGEEQRTLDQRVHAATLYLPGDGSATVTHTDALGNLLGRFAFERVADDIETIGDHLRGLATRQRFAVDPGGELAIASRFYIVHYEGDASLDPANPAELGGAVVDQDATDPSAPESTSVANEDLDCDRLAEPYDLEDNRFAAALYGEPEDVVSSVVGASVPLRAWLENAPDGATIAWDVLGGDAFLGDEGANPVDRTFTANAPGLYQVEARATVEGQTYSHFFFIEVAPPRALPSCTPAAGASALPLGESAELTAVIGASSVARDALTVQWGVMRESLFQQADELVADGDHATYTPGLEGTHLVACRVSDGTSLGTVGTRELAVLPAGTNRLPVDLTVAPQSVTLFVEESVTLTAAGSDPDGDPLRFAWSASGGTLGTPSSSELASSVGFTAHGAGLFEVQVSIEDGAQLPQVLTVSILVIQSESDLTGGDVDGDGWPAGVDCNDSDPDVNPRAVDHCGDEVDDDCSGSPRTTDCDGDGESTEDGDCDYADAAVNTAAIERCDGVDNDCDEAIDDGFGAGGECAVGAGECAQSGRMVCTPDGANVVCDAQARLPAPEVCDGRDNDCDGSTDEGYVPTATSCGQGMCAAAGQLNCVGGQVVDSCTPGKAAQSDTVCDGRDEDCNGQTDEDFVSSQTQCGTGACASTGMTSCAGGQLLDSCQQGSPAAGDATCNGVDDDCNGQADEDYVATPTTCGTGACAATGTLGCVNGSTVNSCLAGTPAETDADCDNVDDDCSGQADEDYTPRTTTCGTGACVASGATSCVDGDERNSCTAGTPAESDADCDGVDDDCSGQTDEDYVSTSTSCGIGSCQRSGTRSCQSGEEVDSCLAGTPAASDADCDGADDDCNGQSDEDYVATTTSCGVGACQASGSRTCQNGSEVDSCVAGTPAASDADCDGVDDDCSGQNDEDYVAPVTSCGVGACVRGGSLLCQNGQTVDSCVAGIAAESDADCDAIDDDCNGQNDEDYVAPATSCGVGVCVRGGSLLCVNGATSDSCVAGTPPSSTDATCDGLDEDCSGQSDEDYAVTETSCGVGACDASGERTCVNGTEQDSCAPSSPVGSDTSCDGVDQDCDGEVDDDFVSLLEVCNGRDDDCNGEVDEVTCSGQGGTCEEQGPEICDGEDDDCDGLFDEDDVCGLTLVDGTLPGVWWECTGDSCETLGSSGYMFGNDGLFLALHSFGGELYDPAEGPYCQSGIASWALVDGTVEIDWIEDGEPRHAEATVEFSGLLATLNWTVPPDPSMTVTFLKRVPEQAGGQCPDEGPECQPGENCENGFDDDCDGLVDFGDPQCQCQQGEITPEICDGLDNDCDGQIDDLSGSCEAAGAQGMCAFGHRICDGEGNVQCVAHEPDPAGEVCPDGIDNDCDGVVDEEGCTQLSAGETCLNPIDVTAGGVFHTQLGQRNDVPGLCSPPEFNDRVFVFSVPAGPGFEYFISATSQDQVSMGGSLLVLPQGWEPGMGCPAVAPGEGMCMGLGSGSGGFRQYLSGGTSYMIVIDSFGGFDGEPPVTSNIALSIAHFVDGQCSPLDGDGDGVSICDKDCDDSEGSVHQGAEELCNGRDDDCDGPIDEQDGTCPTGLTGVCGLGLPTCEGGSACLPIQPGSPADYCNDGADNDCDGAIDEDCVDMPGEACTNAVDLGLGGTFFGSLATANDDAVSRCGNAPDGRERFFRITVPEFTSIVFEAQQSHGGVRYVVYRDCTLEPVTCFLANGEHRNVEPGTYLVAVEQENAGPGAATDFAFTIGLEQEAGCLTPDLDGDGFDVCDRDCNENDPTIHPAASEGAGCDQIDNDCDGMVDDIQVGCAVPGQQGVCADGALRCVGEGTFCEQIHEPDAQNRDYCDDGLDNDCDGASDDADPQLCVELLAGDVCSLPQDVGPGGVFTGSLEGYGDDVNLGCGDGQSGGPGAVERFYAITVNSPRRLRAFARLLNGDTGGVIGGDKPTSGGMQVMVLSSCGQFAQTCSGTSVDTQLLPGTYLIAVTGEATMQYELYVATSDIEDSEGVTCSPADSDGDGFNLCNGDCNEGSPAVHVGATESCDGVDNDCDFFVDDGFFGGEFCLVEGAQGECAAGRMACLGGAMGCQAEREPGEFPEVCANETDEDCDGPADDQGVPGVDCTTANGESCELARPLDPVAYLVDSLEGATDDGQGCFGGVNGDAEEKYYAFDAPTFGQAFVHAKPLGSGPVPEHSVGMFGASCSEPQGFGCRGPGYGGFSVQPGPLHIVLESDQPFAYELQVAFRAFDNPTCSVPDRDGDGFTLCDGDCDDSEPARFFGAPESCDGIDNDCDGGVDNLGGPSCETGIPGICGTGSLECSGGVPTCVPDQSPRPNDICGDGLDNDCDEQTDELGCDELPAGETCGLAIDVSSGGAFPGTLLGRTDDNAHCSATGSADTYFTFTVGEGGANVYFDLVPTFDPGGPEPLDLMAHLFLGCDMQQGFGCFQRFQGGFLGQGEWKLAIEANRAADFALFIAFDSGLGCQAGGGNGDFDGDGTTICNNDCNEMDVSVHPGVPEVCNNFRDDDCDGMQDQVPFTPCASSAPGECAAGRLECPEFGANPVCMPIIQPGSQPELCADGLDNDCNEGTDEPSCVPATGNSCELAINLDLVGGGETSGNITDTADDAPGCSNEFFGEKVYRVTAPVLGFMYAQATPAPGFTGEFRVRNSDGNCFGPAHCDSAGSAGARPVEPGHVYFLAVDGPPNTPFVLRWALRPGEDQFSGPCFDGMSNEGDGDFDGDFQPMCGQDCNEADPNAFMGAPEVCGNQRDDSCNGMVDEEGFSCETDLFGICAFGQTICEVSGEPASCEPFNTPQEEFCNGQDDDCDGDTDEDGVCF